MKFIKLTREPAYPTMVRVDKIVAITSTSPSVTEVLLDHGESLYCKETPEEVYELLSQEHPDPQPRRTVEEINSPILLPLDTCPRDTYVILFGKSGYVGTPFRCEVCRYDPQYNPEHPWITYCGDSFLESGGPPVGWIPLPIDASRLLG